MGKQNLVTVKTMGPSYILQLNNCSVIYTTSQIPRKYQKTMCKYSVVCLLRHQKPFTQLLKKSNTHWFFAFVQKNLLLENIKKKRKKLKTIPGSVLMVVAVHPRQQSTDYYFSG
jgi:hypothetical protein